MIETMVQQVVASTTATITSVLTTNVPVIAVVFAGLVGLGIALHFVKRLIGRRA